MRWNGEVRLASPVKGRQLFRSSLGNCASERREERKNRCESSDKPPQTGRKLVRRRTTARRSACSSFRKPAETKKRLRTLAARCHSTERSHRISRKERTWQKERLKLTA